MSNASTVDSIESHGPDAAYAQYREWINAPAESGDPELEGERARRTWQTVDSPALGKRLIVKRSGTEVENFAGSNKAGLPANRRPRWKESLLNEVRAIEYVHQHFPSIPVPSIICHYEDRGCYCVIEEYVEGAISADAVPADQYHLIIEQLEQVSRTLRQDRRSTCSSFTGRPFLPARFMRIDQWIATADLAEDQNAFVLCHGDLASHNVLVHPHTYEIICIIDWEYASWLPEEIVEVWPRRGPVNCALDDDPHDVDLVVDKLYRLARGRAPSRGRAQTLTAPDSLWKSVIPGKPAWDRTILPKPSWIEVDRSRETPLQKRLRNFEIGYPHIASATVRSLGLHLILTCRNGVAGALEDLADDMVYDYQATTDFLREMAFEMPNWWLLGGQQMTYIHELSSILPQILRDLAAHLNLSGVRLSRLRQHFLDRDKKNAFRPSNKSALQMDLVYREVELERWTGWMEAGASITRVAHVALKLADSLPFDDGTYKEARPHDPPHPIAEPLRERYEARAEAILAGSRAGIVPTIYDAFDETYIDPLAARKKSYEARVRSRFTAGVGINEQRRGLTWSTYPHPGLIPKRAPGPRDAPWPPSDGKTSQGVKELGTRPRRQSEPRSPSTSDRSGEERAHEGDAREIRRSRSYGTDPVSTLFPVGRSGGYNARPQTRLEAGGGVPSTSGGRPEVTVHEPRKVVEKQGMRSRIKELVRVKSKLRKRTDGRTTLSV